ncbi:MAG: hypothetical protein ACE5FE_01720 [Acidiferrobacterales bacterium]
MGITITSSPFRYSRASHRESRLTIRPREVKTLAGQTVFYNRNGKALQIDQLNAHCKIVRTNNGNVVIVDSVLLLQFVD